MPALLVSIELLTGRYVAASVSAREGAEWPPHPGRVFMAMASACFEMGEVEGEVAALQWLEALPPPRVQASQACERSPVSVYVPVNDKVTASKSLLQSAPGLSRSKQERAFPTSIPEDNNVFLVWDNVSGCEEHLPAIQQICANTIRVGHSSSLVRMAASLEKDWPDVESWIPEGRGATQRMRVVGAGELERLRIACKADLIDQFAELTTTIETKKKSKVKADKQAVAEAKKTFATVFGQPYKASLRPPEPTPPVLGLWQGYRRSGVGETTIPIREGKHFESELLVLCKLEGPVLGLQDTLAITQRLREAAISRCEVQPPPSWLSGHEADGSATADPHAAFLALPYVGGPYADGHLMGAAIALPKNISPQERGVALRGLLLDRNDEAQVVELKLGRLGTWTVRLEPDNAGRRSLQNQTWVGPSRHWASATPVVLDRYPKSSRVERRAAWESEVRQTIALSCERAGLPRPIIIDLDTTSWHTGAPRAYPKSRRGGNGGQAATARLGDGFPTMPARAGKPSRPQIHVFLEFEERVHGPILIGAGRFLGYGMCKPCAPRRTK